jgi:hypothetical protein
LGTTDLDYLERIWKEAAETYFWENYSGRICYEDREKRQSSKKIADDIGPNLNRTLA